MCQSGLKYCKKASNYPSMLQTIVKMPQNTLNISKFILFCNMPKYVKRQNTLKYRQNIINYVKIRQNIVKMR